MKRTLVIGNGFDLNVGLNTSYKSFASSTYWPFEKSLPNKSFNTLASFLQSKSDMDTWFDVEEALYEYAKKDIGGLRLGPQKIEDKDKGYFEQLRTQLAAFLKNQENNFIPNEGSVAASLISAFIPRYDNDQEKNKIYSFNYTDLNAIMEKHGIYKDFRCDYIHGSLSTNDIILGVGDARELKNEYFFFYKTSSPHFSSHRIIPDLQESDEVIIFGHSLGYNDYPYFKPFFTQQTSYKNYTRSNRKKITILTKDQASVLEIKRHLRDLTSSETTLLYALNDFNILCTDGSMKVEVNDFLRKLEH